MALTAGERLGPYEIIDKIGAGGMGEVYRARDTKLDREVAVKILPEALARDPERLARFEREAKVLASLNHPNIAQIYGVVDSQTSRALVMELVPGETLKGPLALELALKYAGQIASALEAAHEKGITHRDLKPANIMVTPAGVVKLLDFGLAAQSREANPSTSENSPTLTIGATQAGVILGTAAYMSPEQASGQAVDRRSDIWSFGVVLLEMLTGDRTFTGETVSHVLAAVLAKEPDCSRAPYAVQRLLKSCLQKDPRQRLQAIGDWKLLLAEEQPAAPKVEVRAASKLPWIAAAALAIVAAFGYLAWWRATRPVEHSMIRLSADLGPGAIAGQRTTVAISPDGTRIVFPVQTSGSLQLATRLLNQSAATPLPGTEGGSDPFFSPNGEWIGFGAESKLKKISVQGGATVTLCEAPSFRGASWGEDGFIVAALNTNSALSRIPEGGGTPQPLAKSPETGETSQRWPQILPGGTTVLFTGNVAASGFDNANIEALNLKTGKSKVVQRGGSFGRYLPTGESQGELVYIHEGVLFGVPFDPGKLEAQGSPAPLLEDVAADPTSGGGQFDFSRTGTLVYRSGKSSGSNYSIVSLDSSGKTQPLIATPAQYNTPRFSPDGKRVAVAVNSGKGMDIYIYDLQADSNTRVTFTGQRDGTTNSNPVWTADGKHIAYASQAGNTYAIWWIRSDRGGDPQMLLEAKAGPVAPFSFRQDGRLSFTQVTLETSSDTWTMPLDLADPEHPKPGKAEKFYGTPLVDSMPMFSPDGRWIAYLSNEQGQFEVFVRPFPGPGGVWQISSGTGVYPVWSRDGKTLFFMSLGLRIMAVDYTTKGDTFVPGKPRPWSDVTLRQGAGTNFTPFDLAPDGKHFAIFPQIASEDEKGNLHVTFLLNFFDEIRRRSSPAR